MKKVINPEIIKETTEYQHDFQCLKKDRKPHCEVESFWVKDVMFVRCPECELCNYKLSYGFSHVCHCPTRKELYRKYKI